MSKYSSLPDIDTAPDVFETEDVPEASTDAFFELQPESTDIDKEALVPGAAAARFQRASEASEAQEGEGRKRAMYRQYLRLAAGTSEYEIAARDPELVETSAQRLRRLILEVQELDEQVQAEGAKGGEGGEGEVRHSMVLSQVTSLRYDLEAISTRLSTESGAATTEEGEGAISHDALVSRRLMERLKKARDPAGAQVTAGLGTKAEPVEIARAAVLEARIADLEALLGQAEGSGLPQATITEGLIPTVARADAQIQFLSQPRVMEAALRRVKALIGELETLESLRSEEPEEDGPPPITQATVGRIDRLFESLEKLDPLVALAPQLVERLRSLKQLHEQADGFGDTLKVLTGEQSKLHAELRALTAQCTGLEKSFDENERGIQRNVERLDARTDDLFERIAKLSL